MSDLVIYWVCSVVPPGALGALALPSARIWRARLPAARYRASWVAWMCSHLAGAPPLHP